MMTPISSLDIGLKVVRKFQFVEQIRNKQQQLGEPHDFTHKQ